jgi:ADP-heptose:LPS heptosyltransferase
MNEKGCPAPPESEPLGYTPERDPFAPGLLQSLPEPPRKVALLRASRIGDFINAAPAIQALREALPQAEIILITLPMLQELASRCPAIDRVVAFPGYPGLADQFFDAARAVQFFQQMQAEQLDLAIQMQGTGVNSNPFMLMLGARYTAGFVRSNDPPGRLAASLPWPEVGHEIERVLALTDFLGAPRPALIRPRLVLTGDDHQKAVDCLQQASAPWIGIHISARDRTRRWPAARFAQAAAALQRQYGGTVLLIGETRDREQGQTALQSAGVRFLNLAGCTSLPVTAAILQRLAVFLTNDTGPAHLAYAVDAPTLTVFGGGDPQRNGPLAGGPFRIAVQPIACRPCESADCPIGFSCLEQISVEQVVALAQQVFHL